jgi:hypothetical protein
METPKHAHTRVSFSTPSTDFSSIFGDDNSPLSSAPSSVNGDSDAEIRHEKATPEQQPTVDSTADAGAAQLDSKYYDTVAWRRGRRKATREPVYTNFCSVSRSQRVNDSPPQPTLEIELEHPSATAKDVESRTTPVPEDNEQHLAKIPRQTSKRNKLISVPDVTLQTPQNELKENIVTALEPAPAHQLRKRKPYADVFASESSQPSAKKAKTTPTKALSTFNPKPKPTSTPRSKPRPRPKSWSAKPKELVPRPPETAAAISEQRSFIVAFDMPPEWLLKERERIMSGAAPTSPGTSFSTQQNTSFESKRSKQSISDSQDQCAQLALAPVPASSQLSSTDVSQAEQTHEAYPPLLEPQQSSDEHESDVTFLLKFASPQERSTEETQRMATQSAQLEHSSQQQQNAVIREEEQQQEQVDFRTITYDATQATQPWV